MQQRSPIFVMMKTIILVLIGLSFVQGGCKFPRQLRGKILTFMVDQSEGNKQISVGRFAVDAINRRTFLKTYDKKGYTHVLRLYNQKKIYQVDPSGACYSFRLTEKFQGLGVPSGAQLFVHGQVGRQGSQPVDIYGYETSKNLGVVNLKEYHIMKITTRDCLPISTTSYSNAGPWYSVVHTSHFYDLNLGMQPDDFKIPRNCHFSKTVSQTSADSTSSRGPQPPIRYLGDDRRNFEDYPLHPSRPLRDHTKQKKPFSSDSRKPPIRFVGDDGRVSGVKLATRFKVPRLIQSKSSVSDTHKQTYDEKQIGLGRLNLPSIKHVSDEWKTTKNRKPRRSLLPAPPSSSADDEIKGIGVNKYRSIKDSPLVRILG